MHAGERPVRDPRCGAGVDGRRRPLPRDLRRRYNRLTTSLAGREIENEDLVNLPNWLPLSFRIEEGSGST